ncbi:MAG: pilus assembly protein PilM [Candidatus Omnitrophica bacterium]|nr:pilus assembly protein PilM [Candidatus Omnitrophota bacterium]
MTAKLQSQKEPRRPVVVVEIGNDWLKVMEGSPASGKESVITKASFRKLVEIKEPVTAALVRIFKELKLSKQGVIACIPRHLLTVRILEFPSINPKDIRDMVSLQVGKQTPYSRDEIIFTYKPIGVLHEGYTKVMLVIARRNLVNARIEVLQKAGIEVEKVGVSSEGLAHWFRLAWWPEAGPSKSQVYDDAKAGDQAVVYVDVDSNYSDLIVVRDAKLVYTRNFLIGANHLLGEEAGWPEKFNEEVTHSIGLYQNEERDAKIVQLFLGGTAAHIPNLVSLLAAKVEVPVVAAEPVHQIHLARGLKLYERGKEDERFISPCPLMGMALAPSDLELDLTSSELRIKKQMEGRRKEITVTGVLAISILMLLSTVFFVIYYKKSNYMTELKRSIGGMEKDAQAVEKMRMAINLVKGRLDARKSSINILNEIARLTPEEIYFTNINIEENKQTVLQGRAAVMSNVFEFVTTLENSPYFENVQMTYTTTKKEKDTEYAKFEIICMHEKHEDDNAL